MKRRRQVPTGSDQNSASQQDPNTGSPVQGEPVFLAVGRLRRSHGIAGEMIMDVLTDFPDRLHQGNTIYVGETHEPIKIIGLRGHNRAMIIHLDGLDNPESVVRFRNAMVFVKTSELPGLPEGEYYHHQLLGLMVINEAGEELGQLTDILETGANDVYLVKTPEGKELLLPAVDEVILNVDLEHHQIRVRPPEWL
jgi:16S rRNA processing protein RimM